MKENRIHDITLSVGPDGIIVMIKSIDRVDKQEVRFYSIPNTCLNLKLMFNGNKCHRIQALNDSEMEKAVAKGIYPHDKSCAGVDLCGEVTDITDQV